MSDASPALHVAPSPASTDSWVLIAGQHWPDCPVELTIGKRSLAGQSVLRGFPHPLGVRPDADGAFLVRAQLPGLAAGTHELRARSTQRAPAVGQRATVLLEERPLRFDAEGRAKIGPFGRFAEFGNDRFAHLGRVPAGLRAHQVNARRNEALQDRPGAGAGAGAPRPLDLPTALPIPGVCNWTPVGPSPIAGDPPAGRSYAGRALAIALDPADPDTVYVGTANGGVWKSVDGGETWLPKSDHEISLACGALRIDPRNPRRLFVGTGEFAGGTPGSYYGNGILRTMDGGDSWVRRGALEFERAEIAEIVFNPLDAASEHLLVASSAGLFESRDGGDNWLLLQAGVASAVAMYVDPARPTEVRMTAAFVPSGFHTAVWNGTAWSAIERVFSPAFPSDPLGRVAFAPRTHHSAPVHALLAGFGDYKGLIRSDDGGVTWRTLEVRLDKDLSAGGTSADGHSHQLTIPSADLTALPGPRRYTTTTAGSPPHQHTVSVSADDMRAIARGEVRNLPSDADATGHAHSFYVAGVWQSTYNLAVAVDPADENTIWLGEVGMWRTRTGGGVFDRINVGTLVTDAGAVAFTHADQHAIVPDARIPGRLWLANDGGVFRSDDNGDTWIARNRGVATLQYLHASTHPRWETIMIGGTQDNGVQRYTGSPSWERVGGGDGGFTAIDPRNPSRMYRGFLGTTFYRSDGAGAPGTWALANTGITGRALSYPPFLLDLHAPDTVWFGTNRLWRSATAGDAWAPVTGELSGHVSALAADPSTPDRVYVATDQGRVYRVERTGATWAPSDVSVSDLTAPPLPVGVGVSDLAVDSAGTVWATISVIWGAEAPGEFTSAHVFRYRPAVGAWEQRTNGLVTANPINTIVVDPTNDARLFCGGDVGVFRTENAGGEWTPWDAGLPNTPVFHLELHAPSRLLRAATHGRSIWERPVDAASCAPVDLYVRDNVLDSGRRSPSPSDQPDPLHPGRRVHWWQSEDIKVDAPEPDYQTTAPLTDYLHFAALEHRTARRDRVNRFTAQVHNRGAYPATRVRARAFFTDATAGLPPLPADFWTGGNPFDGTPATTHWTPVGPTRDLGTLQPAVPGAVTWEWRVPAGAAEHSCLLLVVTCDEDPLLLTGVTDVGWAVHHDKRITLKNLHVEDAVPGMAGEMITMELRGGPNVIEADLVLEWGDLPEGSIVELVTEVPDGKRPWHEKALADGQFTPAAQKDAAPFPGQLTSSCGAHRPLDTDVVLRATRGGKASRAVLPRIRLPQEAPLAVAFRVTLPKGSTPGTYQMDLLQQYKNETQGGCSYRWRVSRE